MLPSGNQTWLAGKYTIKFGDFPIEPPMKRVDFQLPRLMTPEGMENSSLEMEVSILWGNVGHERLSG